MEIDVKKASKLVGGLLLAATTMFTAASGYLDARTANLKNDEGQRKAAEVINPLADEIEAVQRRLRLKSEDDDYRFKVLFRRLAEAERGFNTSPTTAPPRTRALLDRANSTPRAMPRPRKLPRLQIQEPE